MRALSARPLFHLVDFSRPPWCQPMGIRPGKSAAFGRVTAVVGRVACVNQSIVNRNAAERTARKYAGEPVSRVLSCGRYVKHQPRKGSHSSRPCVAARLKQPTRAVTGRNTPALHLSAGRAAPIRSCSGWGLPCGRRCRFPGALLPHPFTLACGPPSFDVKPIGGLLSVALSLGFGRAALTDDRFLAGRALPAILVSWSPDFPRTGFPDAAARLPGASGSLAANRPLASGMTSA